MKDSVKWARTKLIGFVIIIKISFKNWIICKFVMNFLGLVPFCIFSSNALEL